MGSWAGLDERSCLRGRFSGRREANGGIGTQAHVSTILVEHEAVYPAPGAFLRHLEIETAAIVMKAGFGYVLYSKRRKAV
jgi:hypothetical protein